MKTALILLLLLVAVGGAGASAADRIVGPPLSVSSSIVDGQTLTGSVSWTATVSDVVPSAVSSVVFTIDGGAKWTEKSSPYVYGGDNVTLDTATLANGLHVFTVVATRSDGVTATVSATATVSNPLRNTRLPSISGDALQGRTLRADRGRWTGAAPIAYAYRWLRCDAGGCGAIPGATGQAYTAAGSDVGRRLRVTVTATNTSGSAEATSAATRAVVNGAPTNTSLPRIGGSAGDGALLTASRGSWRGSPIAYGYQWHRCDSNGSSCSPIAGTGSRRYRVVTTDVGHTLRITVTAANHVGAASATSGPTAVVKATAAAPASTSAPAISGAAQEGSTLTADRGGWSGTDPIAYTYQWRRCDGGGGSCGDIAGASGTAYRLTSAEVGHTIRVDVTARNGAGATLATSRQTGVVAPALPATGTISVTQVSLPDLLVIDNVSFSPNPVRSRDAAIVARFHVSDLHGLSVQGALVYALGLPYGWVGNAPEAATDGAGWATVVLQPTAELPVGRTGALVVFVRARKPGDDLLSGVSTRRLVQVTLGG